MNISITDLQNKFSIPVLKIRSITQKALKKIKVKGSDLSIVFVGEQRMRSLNKAFLGHDYVTDVVTFAHGEIVICPAEAARNAKAYKQSVLSELLLCVVHGILHLAGYDDYSPADINKMREKENEILFPSPSGRGKGRGK